MHLIGLQPREINLQWNEKSAPKISGIMFSQKFKSEQAKSMQQNEKFN